VKEPSENGDIWVRFLFGSGSCTVSFYFRVLVPFSSVLGKACIWFGSFLLGLGSFPSLYTTCRVGLTVTAGDTETHRRARGFQPRLDGVQGRIRRLAKIILARYDPLSGSPNVATFIGVDLS